jgi:predicted PurR-regulated permease PerM
VGIVPVWLVGAAWLFGADRTPAAFVMLAAGGVAGVADNVVRPWVLRGREAMHPLVSLLAILGGIERFGLLGVFVGPVFAAMAIGVLEAWPAVAQHSGVPIAGHGHLADLALPPNRGREDPPQT